MRLKDHKGGIYIKCCVSLKVCPRRIWVRAMSLEKLESITDVTGNSLSLSLSFSLSLSLSHTHTHTKKIEFHSSWFIIILCHDSWMLHVCWVCMHEISQIIGKMFCCNSCKIHFFWICHIILLHENHSLLWFHDSSPFFFFAMIEESCMYVGYVWH